MDITVYQNKRKWFQVKKGKKVETMTDADYADDLTLFSNTPVQAEFLLHSLVQVAGSIGFYVNTNKTNLMRFKQKRAISTLSVNPLKLVDKFTYLGSNISSTESNVNTHLV